MKIFKPKFWDQKKYNFLAITLLPISIIVQLINYLRFKLGKKRMFPFPVICVGNIYVGGTGKTPLSIKVSEILTKFKKKPAIIKKYYKNHDDEVRLINSKTANIVVGKTRAKAIEKAIAHGFNAFVLDDGFQDYSIYKDIEILCFNEKQLLGNGLTIPSGPLREGIKSVRRSNLILVNGEKNEIFERQIKKHNEKVKIFYSKYISDDLEKLKNKKIFAFAGIGNPQNFFDLLKKNNLDVVKSMMFPDHYNYSKEEIQKMINIAKDKKLSLITTEKDYFRISKYGFKDILQLKIKIEIFAEEAVESEIGSCL